jgi:hypothetical protein
MRDRLASAVEATLPRTTRLLGQELLRRCVDEFLTERAPRSPYFRDVGGEIIRWSFARCAHLSELAPHFVDAAQLELACFEVSTCASDPEATPRTLSLSLPVRLSQACRVLRLSHAVHRVDETRVPPRERCDLLVYRDQTTKRIVQLELTDAAARILLRLSSGENLDVAISAGLADASVERTDAVLGEIAALLADLAERGVVLGAAVAQEDSVGANTSRRRRP